MSTIYKRAGSHNWNDATAWSLSSGGANDAGVPTAADEVILDALSGDLTITALAAARALDCDRATPYAGVLTHNGGQNLDLGDATAASNGVILRFSAGMTYTKSFNSTIRIQSSSTTQQQVISNGKAIGSFSLPNFSATNPNIIFGDVFDIQFIQHNGGILGTNDKNGTIRGSYAGAGANGKTLNLTSSIIEIPATGTFWNISSAGLVVNPGTSELRLTVASASARTFAGGGKTYNKLTYTIPGSTGSLTISGNNTIAELNFSDANNARTLTLTAGNTQIITTPNILGTAGKLMTIQSSSGGSPATISKPSGVWSSDYLSVKDITATGGATFYAGSNSTDVSGNTGWLFNSYFSMTLTDSIALTETLGKSIAKTIIDILPLTETLIKSVDKALTDAVSLTETLQKQVGKTFNETITLVEQLQKSIAKTTTDTVTLVESLRKGIGKTFNEQAPTSYLLLEDGSYFLLEDGSRLILEGGPVVYEETLTKATSKRFSEVITLVETFVIPFIRKFSKNKLFLRVKRRITFLK